MTSSSARVFLTFFLLLGSSVALAQSEERLRVWESLRVADDAFAERSRTMGMNQAFLDVFGEGAVIFRDGPIDARSFYEQVPPRQRLSSTFESRANYIDFSRAGDLGLSSGPYRYSAGFGEESRRTYGHFVTIWRKVDTGWSMVAEVVVRVPGVLSLDVEPDIAETDLLLAETAAPEIAEQNTLESLLEADERFIASINFRGGRRAVIRYGVEHLRIFVPGMAPGIGNESGAAVYGAFLDEKMDLSPLTYEPAGAYMATSGDAGYTYGTMTVEGDSFSTNYLRYWHFTKSGEWKVALEVLTPF